MEKLRLTQEEIDKIIEHLSNKLTTCNNYSKFRFTGGNIAVSASETGTSYYNVIIDGKVTKKMKITGTSPQAIASRQAIASISISAG